MAFSPLTNSLVKGAALALSFASAIALAQSSDDLFAPAPPQPERPHPTAMPKPASGEVAVPEAQARTQKQTERALGPGERDVNLEDRVKAVQRKGFIKAHRLGVSGTASASLSDAFYQKWGGGAQATFAFADPFALALNYSYFYDQTTSNVSIAKEVLSSQLSPVHLHSLASADFQWTPIYGKAQLANHIIYFDLYPLAGFGAVDGESSWIPMVEVGLGERIFLADFLSVGLEAKYSLYVDGAANNPSVVQRVLFVSGLVTLWFPGAGEGQ